MLMGTVQYSTQITVQSDGQDVLKIESANHAAKSYCSGLEQLAKDFPFFVDGVALQHLQL